MAKIASFPALVIRCQDYGENDILLTLLTEKMGRISVLVKGGKSIRSKNISCSQLFCYSEFEVSERNGFYYLSEASLIEQFYNLRADIEKNALAQYIVDVAGEVCVQDTEGDEILSLTLNTLYLISEDKKSREHIKAVFEIRCASIAGFMPDLTGCRSCGRKQHDQLYLDVMNGIIVCGECFGEQRGKLDAAELATASIIAPLSDASLDAMRYVLYADSRKIFSFSIPDEDMEVMSFACEKYLLNHLERSFTTLEFYKKVKKLG